MNLSNALGGYFELELANRNGFLHDDAILLNSGRACFEYVLKAVKPKRVYMPKYTCDVMLEPLERTGVEYVWYEVNEQLEIVGDIALQHDELLLYTNYFGVKDNYCRKLSGMFRDRLVLDCSQAFYFEPLETGHTFYSPRKFFGLPDGGMLYSKSRLAEELSFDTSVDRFQHLLKRIDLGAEAGYQDFKTEDASLSSVPLLQMSMLTRRLLASIDFETARKVREANFALLRTELSDNQLRLEEQVTGPMCYPYLTDKSDLRQRLIDQKVFVATYWSNVREWCTPETVAYQLTDRLLPLPIDQRYNEQDMQHILEVVRG